MDTDKLLEKPLNWNNLEHFIALLPVLDRTKFTLFCAEQASSFITDTSFTEHISAIQQAIQVSKNAMQGKSSIKECIDAYKTNYNLYFPDSLIDAFYENDTDKVIYPSIELKNACMAAGCAARVAGVNLIPVESINNDYVLEHYYYLQSFQETSHHYALEAAHCAVNAAGPNSDAAKEAQINYLYSLILDNLTEEQKNCWLLLASI